jgi:hypothetical protein
MACWEELCDGYQIDIRPLAGSQPPEDSIDYFNLDDFDEDTARKIVNVLDIPGADVEIMVKTEDKPLVRAKMRRHSFGHKPEPDPDMEAFIQSFRDKIQHSLSAGHSPDSSFEEDSKGRLDVPSVDETPEEDGIEEDGILVEDGAIPAWSEEAAYRQITLEISRENIDAMRPLAERLMALKTDGVTALPDELCNISGYEEKNLTDFLSELHEGFWRNEKTAELKSNAFICAIEELSRVQDTYEFFSWLNHISEQRWVGILDQCNQEYNLVINN